MFNKKPMDKDLQLAFQAIEARNKEILEANERINALENYFGIEQIITEVHVKRGNKFTKIISTNTYRKIK